MKTVILVLFFTVSLSPIPLTAVLVKVPLILTLNVNIKVEVVEGLNDFKVNTLELTLYAQLSFDSLRKYSNSVSLKTSFTNTSGKVKLFPLVTLIRNLTISPTNAVLFNASLVNV